jgi:radical SAM superfamily enzyme YgiQ (UPF0313 family)
MAIITSYFKGERYGLLGPQMAATIIQDNTPYACIVIAVTRDDERASLKKALADYFGVQRPIIGFSALSGREDLFSLAKELREEGAITILAGPQANVDFLGENDWQNHPHRFKGLSAHFSFGLQGPAEQIIQLLNSLDRNDWSDVPGLLYQKREDVIQNPPKAWDRKCLEKVRWDNIYRCTKDGMTPLKITSGQVLQHIGCPHAKRIREIEIDYPVSINAKQKQSIKLRLKGCSFCDVAADKGFFGKLDTAAVISQIRCLPQAADGRKIPFELINENPLGDLLDLLKEVKTRDIPISQINLTLRADGLILGLHYLRQALRLARETGIYVLLSAIGFESFDDSILHNLNKGLSVEKNLQAIRLMRQLKEEFPAQMGYSSKEGANHGFIHPTAWDTKETFARIQETIYLYGLQNDILPAHSTPLIIHHASALGHWIREIERRERLCFKRYGSIIGWWEAPQRC